MNYSYPDPNDPMKVSKTMHEVALEAFRYYAKEYRIDYLMSSLHDNFKVYMTDELTRLGRECALSMHSLMLKGEQTIETRKHTHEYTFPVFATWLDHLKYDLREGRVCRWLPKWFTNRLQVRYISVKKTGEMVVPTTMIKCCPHS